MGLEFLAEDPDEETRKLIAQFQREEEEEVMRAETRRIQQLEADEVMARREQQSEREVWHMMQQMQLETRRRQQEQIEQDALRAVSRVPVLSLTVSANFRLLKIGACPMSEGEINNPHLEEVSKRISVRGRPRCSKKGGSDVTTGKLKDKSLEVTMGLRALGSQTMSVISPSLTSIPLRIPSSAPVHPTTLPHCRQDSHRL